MVRISKDLQSAFDEEASLEVPNQKNQGTVERNHSIDFEAVRLLSKSIESEES
jgi:hypothetical protein